MERSNAEWSRGTDGWVGSWFSRPTWIAPGQMRAGVDLSWRMGAGRKGCGSISRKPILEPDCIYRHSTELVRYGTWNLSSAIQTRVTYLQPPRRAGRGNLAAEHMDLSCMSTSSLCRFSALSNFDQKPFSFSNHIISIPRRTS